MNYFFNYFGYKYESIIENSNFFFHFVSQAWIVNAFKLVKENTDSSDDQEDDYSSILKKLLDVNVEMAKLLSSLELITETIYVSDPAIKLTELTLGKNFLKHIKKVLNETKDQRKVISKISKTEFDNIVMDILKKTVNLTINEFDKIDQDKNNLILYETYNELVSKNEDLTLEEFTQKVEEKRKKLKS